MNVSELRDLIETLRKRIRDYEKDFKASEALTRYALVDPLLRGMGWDIDDPDQVRPEDSLEDGRADYVLLGDDLDAPDMSALIPDVQTRKRRKVLLVEAKRLSEDLWKAARQALRYASSDEVRYFAVTDGQRWHVYDREKRGGIENGRISCFDLTDEKAANDCKRAKNLWRSTWHIEFVHGWRVDADGKVRSPENGKENKGFRKLRPRGTRWILRTDKRGKHEFLNAAGWVLTDKGNRSSRFNAPCPPDTAKITNGKFLDANGKEILPKKGRRR